MTEQASTSAIDVPIVRAPSRSKSARSLKPTALAQTSCALILGASVRRPVLNLPERLQDTGDRPQKRDHGTEGLIPIRKRRCRHVHDIARLKLERGRGAPHDRSCIDDVEFTTDALATDHVHVGENALKTLALAESSASECLKERQATMDERDRTTGRIALRNATEDECLLVLMVGHDNDVACL